MQNDKTQPLSNVYVFEDEEDDQPSCPTGQLVEIDFDSQSLKRSGRPTGSLGRVNEDHDVTLSDFAYLRAIIQGIDSKKAAHRYLHGKVYMTPGACEAYEMRLRAILQRTIKVHLDESERKKASGHLEILSAPTLRAVALGPSLEEFSSRFDFDMYSEAELQELYMEEFGAGLDQAELNESLAIGYGVKAKLNALNWLSEKIAKKPSSSDPLELWVEPGLREKFRQHGVVTIGNLMDWVNLQGRTFYRKIPGFGVTRGRRLALWLMDNEEDIGRRLDRRIRFQTDFPGTTIDVTDHHAVTSTVLTFGIVPLDRLDWPASLLGHDGVFRNQKPNTLGAMDDRDAIERWFTNLTDKASPATLLSYRRAIERLVLWAIVEKRAPLSSLVTEHFVEFRAFLRSPPAHWCGRLPTVRHSPDWRPLRGTMKEASIQQTFSAISAFYSALTKSGYLTANAVSSVRTSVKRDLRMDVMRSFSEEDLISIGRTMDEIEDGPHKRRLRAIILLLQTGGFRRREAISLRYSHLTPLRQDNRITNMWVATFYGKGHKERKVPIKAETYEALQDHYRDRLDLIQNIKQRKVGDERDPPKPLLAAYSGVSLSDTPLLSILDDRFAEGREATVGDTAGNSRLKPNKNGALSYGRIDSILKSFFKKVAQRDDLPTGHADFMKASTHWLRHTFGLQAMVASSGNLPAVQLILGHADIATTGIYMKADLSARVTVVDGIKGAV